MLKRGEEKGGAGKGVKKGGRGRGGARGKKERESEMSFSVNNMEQALKMEAVISRRVQLQHLTVT